MRRSNLYQISLIVLGFISLIFFAVFIYREAFPEYKIYQDAYIDLSKFYSNYTKEPPPLFKTGVKQILIESKIQGPEKVDRCISCHVALEINYFSPTQLAKDINGKIILDEQGNPKKEENPHYIWKALEDKIAELTDPEIMQELEKEGQFGEITKRWDEALRLKSYQTAKVGDHLYDMTKVLQMHPLIGKETRPFEFHPIEEYGCVSCHNGNGRALTTDKAHGPIFDETYEIEYMGPERKFAEVDVENDPHFAHQFNHKPGSKLLFQTSPLYIGPLMQAKCLNCHQGSNEDTIFNLNQIEKEKEIYSSGLKISYQNQKKELEALLKLENEIQEIGFVKVLENLKQMSENYSLGASQIELASSQLSYLEKYKNSNQNEVLAVLKDRIKQLLGSQELAHKLLEEYKLDKYLDLNKFIELSQGTLFNIQKAFQANESHPKTDIDILTKNYHRGKELYISQACYACHRISGFTRGGVGPELTKIGNNYPWYIKQSIVWPQADLPNSAMPNYRLDHEELQDLMTFLLAQIGETNLNEGVRYRQMIQAWDQGKLQDFEKDVSPEKIHDVRYGMEIFALEGCAACHRLKGYESNVGYALEKESKYKEDFKAHYEEKEWFKKLFREDLLGSEIVKTIDEHRLEIDRKIVDHVRENSILEEIEKKSEDSILAMYSNFRYALRAKNNYYQDLIKKYPESKKRWKDELKAWKETVRKVLKIYIQEYGFGRLICPKPNWSGIYRSDQWLMEHFRNPTSHVPRSIMPIFPFDNSKFYALTYMLNILSNKNRLEDRKIWDHFGFKADKAVEMYCSQCHGELMEGNGPVSQWIYPIPKNLKNAEFLRNLTKEKVIESITHGVKGTPMGPWGEFVKDKPFKISEPILTREEIDKIAEFLFEGLSGGEIIRSTEDVKKWHYTPQDVIDELKREKGKLESNILSILPRASDQYVSVKPIVQKDSEIANYFDVVKNTNDEKLYYIKKKYYTEENIAEGQNFFELNCAVCHGKEADGSGIRAEVMSDSKPRMLTNLDWIHSRDDLRLLRSIKFGVPGTSMTPWGDQTNALQRLQLVIFIRSLTESKDKLDQLTNLLYQVYDEKLFDIERERQKNYQDLQKIKEDILRFKTQQKELENEIAEGKKSASEAVKNYEKMLEKTTQIQQLEKTDSQYLDLIYDVKLENKLIRELGESIASKKGLEEAYKLFLKRLSLLTSNETKEDEITEIENEIIKTVEISIQKLNEKKSQVDSEFPSSEKAAKLAQINGSLSSLKKLKNSLLSGFHESKKNRIKNKHE